jgi:hypothetical protein
MQHVCTASSIDIDSFGPTPSLDTGGGDWPWFQLTQAPLKRSQVEMMIAR